MAGVSEKVAGHLERMEADEILARSTQVEKIDNGARRTFGLDNLTGGTGTLNVNVLAGGRAVVQVEKSSHSKHLPPSASLLRDGAAIR